jgi:mRNA interferase RelE/StbE
MTYKIAIENKALAELATLPKKIQRQVANKIDRLSTNARPSGCKILKTGKSPLYRIRSGDYRIVYQIQEQQVLILVVRIAHRKDVYKRL